MNDDDDDDEENNLNKNKSGHQLFKNQGLSAYYWLLSTSQRLKLTIFSL